MSVLLNCSYLFAVSNAVLFWQLDQVGSRLKTETMKLYVGRAGRVYRIPDSVGTNPAVFNRENTGRLEGEKIGNNFYEVSIKCQCHVHLICCCEYVELHVRSELEM